MQPRGCTLSQTYPLFVGRMPLALTEKMESRFHLV